MPDVVESEQVQIVKATWAGRAALAKELCAGVATILTAAAALVGAWYVSRVDKRVEQVEHRAAQTGEAVDHLKANARMVYYNPPPDGKGKE